VFRAIRCLAVVSALAIFAGSGVAMAQAPTPGPIPSSPTQVENPGLAPAAPLVSDPEYKLGDGDIVDIVVIGSNDFNTRTRVSADGAVLLPLLGAIPARGETPASLASLIAGALKKGGYFAAPVVRVELAGIRSRYVTVLGAVSTPGLIPLDRSYRLSEMMARVGGRMGTGSGYVVLTPAGGPSKRFRLSELATGSGADDPIIQPGDKIYVPPVDDEVFYVTGEVKKPGEQSIQPNLTVRIALAIAGGVSENGSEKKVSIVRAGEKLKGVNLDTKVMPGDVLSFGARVF